ncbi:ATP-grasp domain-containing protein [Actinocrispum wychmicini]|uniref:Biotin carboxylase n=1 Tax=Actinocrispum wychmicini TaxID=1213861 RepID=A0A4R2JS00_9PSEU|nr:ATP-grasp domain-containing protein [Actinocrispum wychmicini]TCO62344.1 biotin carboxylase [Actinocrispum wychmicini]
MTSAVVNTVQEPLRTLTGSVVLVDGVLNGRPFKKVCADAGLPVVGVYTIERCRLDAMAADHASGDAMALYDNGSVDITACVTGRVAAVIPATEPAVHRAALLARHWGVPANSVETAYACRDKRAMRRRASARGLRVPRFFAVRDVKDIPAAVRRVGLPAIVKPATGAASHNVILVRGPADLDRVRRAQRYDLFGGVIDEWLVEEYVRGREFAINTFSFGGRHVVVDAWEYRQPSDADYDNPYWDFVQLGPRDQMRGRLARFARQVLSGFEVHIGPAHIEAKLGPDGLVLIEIGARLPGAGIPEMWERYSDLRAYQDTLAGYLGHVPKVMDSPPVFTHRVGMCFIRNQGPPGVLRRLNGVDEAVRIPGVAEVITHWHPGDTVPTTRDLGTELAKVRLAVPPGLSIVDVAGRVRETISVDVEPV